MASRSYIICPTSYPLVNQIYYLLSSSPHSSQMTSKCFLEHNRLLSQDLLLSASTSKNTLHPMPLYSLLPHFFQVTLSVRSYLIPLYDLQYPYSIAFFPLHYLPTSKSIYFLKFVLYFASVLIKYKLYKDKRLVSVCN